VNTSAWLALAFIASLMAAASALAWPARRDPQRLFTPAQRDEIHRRAGYRCEHKPLLGRRCSNPSEQADHVFPHSGGWPTTLDNSQGLCAPCNNGKSAWRPTRFYVRRLERRRVGYFPEGVSPKINRRTFATRRKELGR
jgi:5-methylcytosine-specific restriction endonuclease McrA